MVWVLGLSLCKITLLKDKVDMVVGRCGCR